jgi:CRISPR-associated protein Cas2
MFRTYLVCYDICNERRLRRVHRLLKGYGQAWQYSVFYCRLKQVDRVKMQSELEREVNQRDDQVLILDLGPDEEAVRQGICSLGPAPQGTERVTVI